MAIIKKKGPLAVPTLVPNHNEEHSRLCDRAITWLRKKGFQTTMKEPVCYTPSKERPDAIGFKDGISVVLEAKTSRADFLADKKKPFRIKPELGMGHWRFFICPPQVILIEDLPDGWGLIYDKGNHKGFLDIHGVPPSVHWHNLKPFTPNIEAERILLISMLRRMQQ